jgi:energy-coupling factor transporter ATP-binding protein EcfA2
MSVPNPETLIGRIATDSSATAQDVSDLFAGFGISLTPVPPTQRSVSVRRLKFDGRRSGTQWDGPFSAEFTFETGVTALITNENLRGKSTVLELLTWGLRGEPRKLRKDVKPWFQNITLEYSVNGAAMAALLRQTDDGFIANVVRSDDANDLRGYVNDGIPRDTIHVIASDLSEEQFKTHQDEMMLGLLSLEPITSFQKRPGSDQGRPTVNSWPAYFGGIYLPKASSDALLGDTVFAGLPARLLQLFCNVPLMSAFIKLNTLTKQVGQDETNRTRREDEDAKSRADARKQLKAQLEQVEKSIKSLPSTSTRSYELIATELRDAEGELDTARTIRRAAEQTHDAARAERQEEERRGNNDRETALAELLFQGLLPTSCPRCEQSIGAERRQTEEDQHQCAVCTKTIEEPSTDFDETTEDVEDDTDALAVLQEAEEVARVSAEEAQSTAQAALQKVEDLAAELTAASRAQEFTDRINLQLDAARLQGGLDNFPTNPTVTSASTTLAILSAATEVLREVTADAAQVMFGELNEEILALGKKFGMPNLESVELDRRGGMKVTTAGVEDRFSQLTGGERLRLRVAVVVALLRIGHRTGVGSHPGLILLDSPGSDELTVENEATLLRELDSLKLEHATLQVIVASAEPAAVAGHIDDSQVFANLDGGPLW